MKNKQKTIEGKRRKHIDAVTNQNERLAALTNKDDHKGNYKKYLKNWLRKRLTKSTDAIN